MIDLVAANHPGREFELMRAGRKPLAMFYACVQELPDEELIPEATFAPYVACGEFIRDEVMFEDVHPNTGHPLPLKYVFFARKGHEWRIRAMILVTTTYRRMRRTEEGIERLESALLGYSEDEIDAWCKSQFGERPA